MKITEYYSTEQAANIAKLIGFVLGFTPIKIAQDEIQAVIAGVLIVGGIIFSWYKRYKRGDLKISGIRKKT